jgi:hypothetical protein
MDGTETHPKTWLLITVVFSRPSTLRAQTKRATQD